jgi:two-component system sensor histidine kinase AlgZ
MPLSSAPASAPIEIVIPDCCNIGVIFRTLLAANGAVLTAVLLRANGLLGGVTEFVELSIVLEPACLSSLLILCGLRRIIGAVPLWGQRLACALVPAAVTGLVVRLIMLNDLIVGSFSQHTMVTGMLIAALFGVVLQHYFEMRTRAFSPALAEARLQALQARIRPHFLFNSLNAVLSLIRTEPKRAETALEDLADLFRVLMRDGRDITSLEDEIRLCKQYLSIEKIRLGERLQVHWDTSNITEEVLRKAQLPALLLQPLLENAVHYGVEPASEPVLIQIHVSRSIDRIEIAVINPVLDSTQIDGVESLGNHMALENIRQRLALVHDVEAQLTTAVARGFFEVRLRLPYVKGPR